MKKSKRILKGIGLALLGLPVILITSCGGNNNPVNASLKIKSVSQNPFCNSGNLGAFCNNFQGHFLVQVITNNNAYSTYLYDKSSTLTSGNLLPTTPSSYDEMDDIYNSTGNILKVSVPKKNSYSIAMKFVEYGGAKPVGSNNACANPVVNGQAACYAYEKLLTFAKKAYPNSSSNQVQFDGSSLSGAQPSCSY